MKKALVSIISGIIIIFGFGTNAMAMDINDFLTEIKVNSDSTIEVEETISVYFSYPQHGIYRDIPVKYKNKLNDNFNLQLDLISVTDEDGNEYEYQTGYQLRGQIHRQANSSANGQSEQDTY